MQDLIKNKQYIYKPTSLKRGLEQEQIMVTFARLDKDGRAIVHYQDRFKTKRRTVSVRFLHEPLKGG